MLEALEQELGVFVDRRPNFDVRDPLSPHATAESDIAAVPSVLRRAVRWDTVPLMWPMRTGG